MVDEEELLLCSVRVAEGKGRIEGRTDNEKIKISIFKKVFNIHCTMVTSQHEK